MRESHASPRAGVRSASSSEREDARWRTFFEHAPIALWEEDFSAVRRRFDELQQAGVTDIETYFEAHPDEVGAQAALVRIVNVSRATYAFFGVERDEDFHLVLPSYFSGAGRVFAAELVALWRGERSFVSDVTLTMLDGSTRIVELRLSVVPGHERELDCVLVSFVDVTARREAEARLRESEERFDAFMTHSPVPAWITDAQGRITYASPAFCSAFARSGGSVIGRNLDEIVPEGIARPFAREGLGVAGATSADPRGEVALSEGERAGGTPKKFLVYAFPIQTARGAVLVGGVAVDMTERANMEDALRQAEQRMRARAAELQAVLEAVPAAVFIARDRKAEHIDANRYGHDLLRVPVGESISKSAPIEFRPPQYTVRVDGVEVAPERMPAQVAAAEGVEVRNAELEIGFTDGSSRVILGNATPFRNDRGETIGSVAAFIDVTEQKRAREQLQQANRMKDEFLATLSHELRTPLQAILGWARLLRTSAVEPKSEAHALEVIERNARSLANLIEEVLDVSRIITGKLRVQPQPMEVDAAVRMAIENVRAAAEAKGITLGASVASDVGLLAADPDRIQQVLWNLLSNAVKFTPRGGAVKVDVSRRDSTVEIAVTDTGSGIPTEFLPHVFERFRQMDQSASRTHGGLGIGLAVVRHLVELHGGEVVAESAGAGQGATFRVKLPVRATLGERELPRAGRGEGVTRGAAGPPVLRDVRVLVVDDEADARDLLSTIFRGHGAQVREAASVSEALASVADFHPDVVVSDIGMPGEDGYQLIRKLRAIWARDATPRIPTLALTAYARSDDRRTAIAAGFDAHLAKPVHPGELVNAVARLVR